MGTGGTSGTPGSSMALCTLHLNLERKTWRPSPSTREGVPFPGCPPPRPTHTPKARKWQRGEENTCRRPPPLESQFNRWEELLVMAIYRHGSQPPLLRAASKVQVTPVQSQTPTMLSWRGNGHLKALRGMLEGARWLLVCAHPGAWTAGLLLVLQAGLDWALQASRGRAGHRAGCWAASQAAGQRVAGRGAASTGAPEQFRAEARVAACVLGQVVAASEALGAERAGKALLPRVRPVVAGQLVRARKLLVAAWPVTGKGALSCMRSQVRFEMRGLVVRFSAAREGTAVALGGRGRGAGGADGGRGRGGRRGGGG